MSLRKVLCLFTVLAMVLDGIGTAQDGAIDEFRRVAAPVLVQRCLACHGGEKTEGGYSVRTAELLDKPGDSGMRPMVAGQPEASELLRRLTTTDVGERMPLDAEPLTEAQIRSLRRWIEEGAPLPPGQRKGPLASLVDHHPPTDRPTPVSYPRPLPIACLDVLPQEGQVVVSGYGEATLWQPTTGKLLRRIPTLGTRVVSLDVDATGTWLAVASGQPGQSGVLELFDLRHSDAAAQVLDRSSDVAACIAFSPDGQRLATTGSTGLVTVFSVPSGPARRWVPHADAVLGLAWSPDGKQMMTASRDRTAKLFDMDPISLQLNYDRHDRAVSGVGFSGSGPLSLDESGRLRLWKRDEARATTDRSGLPRMPTRLVGDGKNVLVPEQDKVREFAVEVKTVDDGKDSDGKPKQKTVSRIMEASVYRASTSDWILSLAAEGPWVAAGTQQGEVLVWDRQTQALVHRFQAKP